MAIYVIQPNDFIDVNCFDKYRFAVCHQQLFVEGITNRYELAKTLKIQATRNKCGVILFDNIGQAMQFVNNYAGHVYDTRSLTMVHRSAYGTALEEWKLLGDENINTFGAISANGIWGNVKVSFYSHKDVSLRVNRYMDLPEIKDKLSGKGSK